jgi:hypothetical protein
MRVGWKSYRVLEMLGVIIWGEFRDEFVNSNPLPGNAFLGSDWTPHVGLKLGD